MRSGFLNEYFDGVATKRLAPVEVNYLVSNQHEFNVNKSLVSLLGRPSGRKKYPAQFIYFDDNTRLETSSYLTLYDARENIPGRSECRLYFPSKAVDVIGSAEAGDSLFLCLQKGGTLLVLVAKQGSTIENQLYYLFDLQPAVGKRFESKVKFHGEDRQVAPVIRDILENIGIEYEEAEERIGFENLLDRYGPVFPSSVEFSAFARSTLVTDPVNFPDETLLLWYERETALFKMLERHIIGERIRQGFLVDGETDVDGFLSFSLSVQNRRKSRAGLALENGISEILTQNHITFTRTPVTENRNRPDFIFPSIEAYRNPAFPAGGLTMLGAKTTSKDRWRQVLDEADRIDSKHLITLEGAISTNQTDQMRSRSLQLVVPSGIQPTYTQEQRSWLWSLADFLHHVRERQKQYAV